VPAPRETELVWVEAGDPSLAEAAELRYRVLYEPFGVARDEMWRQEEPGVLHLLAVGGERLEGYGCLIDRGREGQLRQLAVDPDARGRGIGSALLAELLTEAARRDIRLVWCHARVKHEAFYARAGFEALGGEFPSGATGLPHRRMERILG
jgi:ribosomal-protein-alanine N-acetyltransferase